MPKIDETEWPIVVIRWPEVVGTSDIDAHFDEMRALITRRREHFAVVLDMKNAFAASPTVRRRAAQRLGELSNEPIGRFVVGSAHVASSSVVKHLLTAVYWLVQTPYPAKIFDNWDEAFAWARARLAEELTSAAEARAGR